MPAAVNVLLITGGPLKGFTTRLSVAVPVPCELIALIDNVLVPAVVGVPEIRPVLVFSERAEGSPVTLNLVGALVAVMV